MYPEVLTVPYRWVVLAIGTAAQMAFSAVYLGIAVLAPELQQRFDLSLAETGVLIAAVSAGSMSTPLAWGLLVDRIGERLVIALGLGCSAAALVAAGEADDFVWLVAALVVAGAGGSCVMSATGRAVAGWFDERQRGLALGLRQTGVPLGGAAAAATLPAVVSAAGIDAAFYLLAGLCLLAAAAGAAGLREPRGHDLVRGGERLGPRPLRDPRIWSLSLGGALLACAQASIVGFTVLFLHSSHGVSVGRAAVVLVAIQLLGTIGRVASGHWSDRYGDRLRPLVGLATAISLALALVAALAQAPLGALVPALIIAGGLAMSWNALAFAATIELAGRLRSGAALGLQQSAVGGVNAAMPLAFAPLVAATSWQFAYAIVAAFPLAAVMVLRWLHVKAVPRCARPVSAARPTGHT